MFKRPSTKLSQEMNSWPMLSLLIIVVVVLTACVVWFMDKAVQNERLAGKQRLTDAYRRHLLSAQERLAAHWEQIGTNLDNAAKGKAPAEAFQQCLLISGADSLVCFDPESRSQYPDIATEPREPTEVLDISWNKAARLENFGDDPAEAARAYADIAVQSTNSVMVARALQAQARCLMRSGDRPGALRLLLEAFGKNRFADTTDFRGRPLAAYAELMALELMDSSAPERKSTLDRLTQRLANYAHSGMPSIQRRFLMQELRALFPQDVSFPTLPAEMLAARFLETHPISLTGFRSGALQLTQLSNLWIYVCPSGRVAALYQFESLHEQLRRLAGREPLPSDVSLRLLAPDETSEMSFLSMPAGTSLPGWRLAVTLKNGDTFDTLANQKIASYMRTGAVVITAMLILALIVGRAFRRQMAVTRLKNDLVATVSHELKTPLASMRLLVDTLLGSERLHEQTTREYLQLISTENARLSRLIDNFLTFSRMERNKYAFDFREITPDSIIRKAADAVRERFETPGCTFVAEVPRNLPPIVADEDGLVTALLNLLDNAFKYSGELKQIALRARSESGQVIFEVQDNGIGLSPRDSKKVFRRFYQVDQHLSRNAGGCGLGLSIVQFIVTAHRGTIRVHSELGTGSTFGIVLPAANSATL